MKNETIVKGWSRKKLGDVLKIGSGKDHKHLKDGDIPVFGTGGLMRHVDTPLHEGETVFIGRKGTINKPFYYRGKFWTVDTLFYTYSYKGTTAKYINHLFKIVNWLRYNEASGVPSLSKATIEKISVDLPSVSEQERITNVLDTWDIAIKKLERKIHLKKSTLRGLKDDLLTGKKRLHNHTDKWKEFSLNELAKIFDGTHQTPNYVESGVPFLSVEHISANDFENTKYISEDVYENESQSVKIEKGDILMTRIGSIGAVKYIDWDIKASFYVTLALLKVKNTIDAKSLSFFMSGPEFQKELWKKTLHVAFPNKINLGDIGKCKISIPTNKSEQQHITKTLDTASEEIKSLEIKLNYLKDQKKYLLNNLITGNIKTPETLTATK